MKKLTYLLFALLLISCERDDPDPDQFKNLIGSLTDDWVWIVNEGGFQAGNSSLSIYQSESEELVNSAFSEVNSNDLGDVFQSISFLDDKAYLVVNNSGKIEVVDRYSLESIETITGFTSPRFMEIVSSDKAYVTDLFDKKITIVNPSSFSITGSIETSGWTEQMTQNSTHVFALQSGKSMVYKINKSTDVIEDSLQLAFPFPNSIVLDKNENMWVLCAGSSWTSTNGGIYQISSDLSILKSFEFSTLTAGSHLTTNKAGSKLYFLQDGIKQFSITDTDLPSTNLVTSSEAFYSFGLNPETGEIYAGDAIDFVQTGEVFRYDSTGVALNDFNVGVIPGRFYFN